jgi:hypothetical protein
VCISFALGSERRAHGIGLQELDDLPTDLDLFPGWYDSLIMTRG